MLFHLLLHYSGTFTYCYATNTDVKYTFEDQFLVKNAVASETADSICVYIAFGLLHVKVTFLYHRYHSVHIYMCL